MKALSIKPNTLRDFFAAYTEVLDDPHQQLVGLLGRIAEAALYAAEHPEAKGRGGWREMQLELEYREALDALDELREGSRESDEALAYIVIDVKDGHN